MAVPDRWAPWIEPAVVDIVSAAQLVISGGAAATLGTLTVTVTPHVDCIASVPWSVKPSATVLGTSFFLSWVDCNGANLRPATQWWPPLPQGGVACALTQGGVASSPVLAKDTAHTFSLKVKCSGGVGSTYTCALSAAIAGLPNLSVFAWLGPITFMPRLHAP